MKQINLFALMLFLITIKMSAQEQGKIRVSLDFAYAIPDSGAGLAINLEPAYNITNNMRVGLKLGVAALLRDINSNANIDVEADLGANTSIMGTFDYSFDTNSSFSPYLGVGFGYVSLANVRIEENSDFDSNKLNITSEFGTMIRGGFEWGKFRLGLYYNLIPKSDLQDLEGNIIGIVDNTYAGINIGFFIGGGKWGVNQKTTPDK